MLYERKNAQKEQRNRDYTNHEACTQSHSQDGPHGCVISSRNYSRNSSKVPEHSQSLANQRAK